MTFYSPAGYSRQTATPIAATDTVVTCAAYPGATALSLPDNVANSTAITVANFSPTGTACLVFSQLRTGHPLRGNMHERLTCLRKFVLRGRFWS
jgi:hypothetical protein